MSHCRLYCPTLTEGTVALSAEESHHAVSSLRMHQGDPVVLFDGRGGEANGLIQQASRRRLEVNITVIVRHPFEFPRRVTLAVAMPKAHRQSYLIEKCTELGATAFWPILGERSVTRPHDAAGNKWQRRAIEAAKQSRRTWIPEVASPMTFAEAFLRASEFHAVAFLHPDPPASQAGVEAMTMAAFLSTHPGRAPGDTNAKGATGGYLIFVGPEGGWAEAECQQAAQSGAAFLCLGPTLLRTETAAVAACALMTLSL